MLDIQAERQRLARSVCLNKTVLHSDIDWKDIHFSDSRRVIYCVNCKVASMSWRRTLIWMTGGPFEGLTINNLPFARFLNRFLPRITILTKNERERRLKEYFKFTFFRHPVERLVSAYKDRLVCMNHGNLRQAIAEKYKLLPPDMPPNKTFIPPFQYFAQYVLYERKTRKQNMDYHWRPQSEVCSPCVLKFDFIGHYESLSTESEYIIRTLDERYVVANNRSLSYNVTDFRLAFTNSRKSSTVTQMLYSTLSPNLQRSLLDLYKDDYAMFGYSMPKIRSQNTEISVDFAKLQETCRTTV